VPAVAAAIKASAAIAEAAMENDDHCNRVKVQGFIAMICVWVWFVLIAHSAHVSCHCPPASHRRWHDLSRNFFFFTDSTWDFIRNPIWYLLYLFFNFWTPIWLCLAQKATNTSSYKSLYFHFRFTRECEDMARMLRAQIIYFEFKTQTSGLK
jgi:hypothetical protein